MTLYIELAEQLLSAIESGTTSRPDVVETLEQLANDFDKRLRRNPRDVRMIDIDAIRKWWWKAYGVAFPTTPREAAAARYTLQLLDEVDRLRARVFELEAEGDKCADYEAVLRNIAGSDYRGNRPYESQQAEDVLRKWNR